MSNVLSALFESPRIARTRRNHALEHATIHVLTGKNPRRALAGHSDAGGFWLLGDLTTDEVGQAMEEALARLRAGERSLAIHPNCGTNLVTAATLSGLAGGLAMRGTPRRGSWLERLPLAILLSTVALIAARPLGMRIQETITTDANPASLTVVGITRGQRGKFTTHRVETRS